jgi:hypothetical protein
MDANERELGKRIFTRIMPIGTNGSIELQITEIRIPRFLFAFIRVHSRLKISG